MSLSTMKNSCVVMKPVRVRVPFSRLSYGSINKKASFSMSTCRANDSTGVSLIWDRLSEHMRALFRVILTSSSSNVS